MMVPAFEGPAFFGIRGSGRNPDRWENQGQRRRQQRAIKNWAADAIQRGG